MNADEELKPITTENLTVFLEPTKTRKRLTRERRQVLEYNAWRRTLPDSCWTCDHFDKCYPSKPCKHNKGRR